jgi:hypothetical protein
LNKLRFERCVTEYLRMIGAASVGFYELTTLERDVIDKLSIRPTMTALLLMDFQRMVVDSYATDKEALLGRVKRLAVAARNSGAMVIHVAVGFQQRPGPRGASIRHNARRGADLRLART